MSRFSEFNGKTVKEISQNIVDDEIVDLTIEFTDNTKMYIHVIESYDPDLGPESRPVFWINNDKEESEYEENMQIGEPNHGTA